MPQTVDLGLPHYAEELFRPHRYKVLYGGRGGAKSWTVARALLAKGAERPLRILCAREVQNSIKDSVHQLLKDQIAATGYPYRVLDTEILHPNGTRFAFTGLRIGPTKIKSYEGFDICWVEEGQSVSAESFKILLPTIRKPGSEIWITFNTDLEDDPVYDMAVAHPLPDMWAKKVGWQDNPWFPTMPDQVKLKDHAYAVDPEAADNVWGGNPRKASDAEILKGKWSVESFEPDDTWESPLHGLDFGFALNPTAAGRQWVRDNTLYIHQEAVKVGLEIDDTAEFILRHIPNADGYVIRADSARPESISYLRRGGPQEICPLPKIVPVVKWDGSIKDGIAHLRGYDRIVIHPRCERAIFEAKHWEYKRHPKTDDILPEVRDLHNDFWDQCRYALQPLIQRREQTPRPNFGRNRSVRVP